jgi:diphosphomevalonate decarboxylase
VNWQCPSNIALVKYWGKKQEQIPCNPSISFSLKNAFSRTIIDYDYDPQRQTFEYELLQKEFNNKKTQNFFLTCLRLNPLLKHFDLKIESFNSFPHSTGIASSASAFGALALCMLNIDYELSGKEINEGFYQKASYLARLGSGSAARSVYGGFVRWDNQYALPLKNIHKNFAGIRDTILIVSSKPKSISSSKGHALMNNHPFAQDRYQEAKYNEIELQHILRNGDWNAFQSMCEVEALMLHYMMLTSTPSYSLLEENSLKIIEIIKKFMEKSPYITYTIDAGPNIHVLTHPTKFKGLTELVKKVASRVEDVLYDEIGDGPVKQ